MAYKLYQTAQGEFAIDWDVCCQIMRSYHRADLQLTHSEVKTESQTSTLNPLSWGLPDLTFVEVSWDKVRSEAQANVLAAAYKLAAVATFHADGIDTLVRELQRMQRDTRRLNTLFTEKQRRATDTSRQAMEQSVASYQSAADYAKMVRDFSGSILIGASTVVTGGSAAVAVASMGTVIKTTAKYQDTGSAGAAAIEMSQQVVCIVIPVARGGPMNKALKTIIGVATDTGKALVEGQSLETSLLSGSVNVPTAVGGELLKLGVQRAVGKVAAPIVIKVAEDYAKKRAQVAIKDAAAPASNQPTSSVTKDLRVSFTDDILLKLAVVDMKKGIGHSWW